jgi:pimeloyl-ACP methyl ester carboxylesterase
MREIAFFSEGARIAAHLYPASGLYGNPSPGVVLCHGFTGIKEWLLPAFASAFSRAGITALTFDYRGFGGSDGARGKLVPSDQVDDIRNALTFFASLPEVDPSRIALWGTSFGGANVLVATALDPRVKVVISQVPFGSGKRLLESGGADPGIAELLATDRVRRVTEGAGAKFPAAMLAGDELRTYFENAYAECPELAVDLELATVDRIAAWIPEMYAPMISPRPLLVVACERDATTPLSEALSIFDHAREPKRLEVLPGLGHFGVYEGAGFERAIQAEVAFLQEYL